VLQLHGNVWAASENAWLPADAWEELADKWKGAPAGPDIVLGFDGSYNQDATALGVTVEDVPHVFVVGLWERPAGARRWVVPRHEVDEAVRAALERWNVRELACDLPAGTGTSTSGHRSTGAPVIHVCTQEVRVVSEMCSRFYAAVVNRELTHDGNERLAAHLADAVVRERPDGAVITKVDRNSPKKIDAAVAAVLAYGRAAVAEPMGGLVY
jgi:phage terminase large subunit-like protein